MSRNIALDILKLSMAFMVVGLHAGFLGDFTSLGQYLTVNGLFRIAVPIFLIINGFIFIQYYQKTTKLNGLKGFLFYILSGWHSIRIFGFPYLTFLLLGLPNLSTK